MEGYSAEVCLHSKIVLHNISKIEQTKYLKISKTKDFIFKLLQSIRFNFTTIFQTEYIHYKFITSDNYKNIVKALLLVTSASLEVELPH